MQKEKINRWSKIFTIVFLVMVISVGLSSFQRSSAYNFINTKIHFPEKTNTFLINGIENSYDYINTYDIIETKNNKVVFLLNSISSVKLYPNTKIQFTRLGENPYLNIISGEVDIQTVNQVDIETTYQKIVLKQGGINIKQTEKYIKIGNYYGSNRISIYNINDNKSIKNKKNLILSYSLPLKKQITIYNTSNKSNWNKVRYSKLNKELRLQSFKKTIVKRVFKPETTQITEGDTSSFLKKILTFNAKKKKEIKKSEFFKTVNKLIKITNNNSYNQIKTIVPVLTPWKDLAKQYRIKNLIANTKDPLTRYFLEIALLKLFNENNDSIDTEIKYFYRLWADKKTEDEQVLIDELNKKITTHENNLYLLEEDYNLVTSLIDNYPKTASNNIINSKSIIENFLFQAVETKTEKIDIVLTSYYKDLYLIIQLIENNNGQAAQELFKKMLIDNIDFSDPVIAEHRNKNIELENEMLSLIYYYKEILHSTSDDKKDIEFNENDFSKYKQSQNQEDEVLALYSLNTVKLRKRPIDYDFSSVVNAFKKRAILIDEEKVSYVLLGGNLLYIQDAVLDISSKSSNNLSDKEIEDLLDNEPSFNCVYHQEKQIISEVFWNGDDPLPPMQSDIPIDNFQSEYNKSLNLQFTPLSISKNIPIKDWVPDVSVHNTIPNYDIQLQKRLTKQKLHDYNLIVKENNIHVYPEYLIVKNVKIIYLNNRSQDIETEFNMRLTFDIDNRIWKVLSIQLIEFPKNKVRIKGNDLKYVYKNVVKNHIDELERLEIQTKAKKDLQIILEKDEKLNNFKIIDKEKQIVNFSNQIFITKTKEGEEIWKVKGTYNILTNMIIYLKMTHGKHQIILKNIEIKEIKSAVKNYKTEQELKEIKKSSSNNKNKIRNSQEAEQIIEEAISEKNFLNDIEMKEIRNMLLGI